MFIESNTTSSHINGESKSIFKLWLYRRPWPVQTKTLYHNFPFFVAIGNDKFTVKTIVFPHTLNKSDLYTPFLVRSQL